MEIYLKQSQDHSYYKYTYSVIYAVPYFHNPNRDQLNI